MKKLRQTPYRRATYKCVFDFCGRAEEVYHEFGPSFFKDGFWVTSDFKLVTTSHNEAKYWIPPHKITFIQKEYVL